MVAKRKVMIVDDVPANITLLGQILQDDYEVIVAKSGNEAIRIAQNTFAPDIVLLDIVMPGLNGYEVCKIFKDSVLTRNVPIIFITAKADIRDETRGFNAGGVDYIRKPISPEIVRARVRNHLALYDQSKELERKVEERTCEVAYTQDVTIHSLAVLAETRDNETGAHIMRTQHYVKILAEYLMPKKKFKDQLDASVIELLFKSAPLHDIGKVGVPDKILLKPGKLTEAEFEDMKKHTVYGRDAMLKSELAIGGHNTTSFLDVARDIAYTHHEKWNGQGYPEGLSGDMIPLSGRLMAIADVYDALISKRVYKDAFSHDKAVEIMVGERGRHFDPDILDAFLKIHLKFKGIANRFVDS